MFLGIARYYDYGHWIGGDFENAGGWPSTWSLDALRRQLDTYHRWHPHGLTHLRWWLFCGADGLIDPSNGDLRTGLSDCTLRHLENFLEEIGQRGFQLLPVLLAFPSDWKPRGWRALLRRHALGDVTKRMKKWLTHPHWRQRLCQMAAQAAELLARNEDKLLAVELYNEPEGQIADRIARGGNGRRCWGISAVEMVEFLSLLSQHVDEAWVRVRGHAPQLTIGSGWNDSRNCNRSRPAATPEVAALRRLQRDLISWHYYGRRFSSRQRVNSRLLAPAQEISAGADLDVILGEVGTRVFEGRPTGRATLLRRIRAEAQQRGYTAMFIWEDATGYPVDNRLLSEFFER